MLAMWAEDEGKVQIQEKEEMGNVVVLLVSVRGIVACVVAMTGQLNNSGGKHGWDVGITEHYGSV